jgi:hypothetical protein
MTLGWWHSPELNLVLIHGSGTCSLCGSMRNRRNASTPRRKWSIRKSSDGDLLSILTSPESWHRPTEELGITASRIATKEYFECLTLSSFLRETSTALFRFNVNSRRSAICFALLPRFCTCSLDANDRRLAPRVAS